MRASEKIENPKFQEYVKRLHDADFRKMKVEDRALEIGVARKTLYEWDERIDHKAIAERIEKTYAKHKPEIDQAHLKECLKGNTTAIELWKRLYDGYSPNNRLDINAIRDRSLDDKDNAALFRELWASLSPAERAEIVPLPAPAPMPSPLLPLDHGFLGDVRAEDILNRTVKDERGENVR